MLRFGERTAMKAGRVMTARAVRLLARTSGELAGVRIDMASRAGVVRTAKPAITHRAAAVVARMALGTGDAPMRSVQGERCRIVSHGIEERRRERVSIVAVLASLSVVIGSELTSMWIAMTLRTGIGRCREHASSARFCIVRRMTRRASELPMATFERKGGLRVLGDIDARRGEVRWRVAIVTACPGKRADCDLSTVRITVAGRAVLGLATGIARREARVALGCTMACTTRGFRMRSMKRESRRRMRLAHRFGIHVEEAARANRMTRDTARIGTDELEIGCYRIQVGCGMLVRMTVGALS
jgi:hypothetical protein